MTQRNRVLTALALALAVATPALAGPPLLCHPFDIGTAKSLPWDGKAGWSQGRADYPIKQLVADTEAIRAFNDALASDDRVEVVLLPIADGLTLARKR